MSPTYIFFITIGAMLLTAIAFLIIRNYIKSVIHRNIATFQNTLIEKHFAEIESTYKKMRGWQHDYHNHIGVMLAHLKLGELDKLEDYLTLLNDDLKNIDAVIKSGNIMVDAILNAKLSVAKENNVKVNIKTYVPKDMNINDVDLCVIIGNLMDNALEAVMKFDEPEERFIHIYIDLMQKGLYIYFMNSNKDKVKINGKRYFSTKGEGRGLGLIRIDDTVNRYNGYINRKHEEGVFATEIVLPIED